MRFKDQQMEPTGRPGLVSFSLWEHTHACLSLSTELPWLSFEETYLGGAWDHSLWVHHLALFCAHHRPQQPSLHQTNTTVTVAHFHDKFVLGFCCKTTIQSAYSTLIWKEKDLSSVRIAKDEAIITCPDYHREQIYMFAYHADLLKNNKSQNKSQLYK